MYFAGHRGTIVHYDGIEFNRIDTGIDTDFRNITGTPDGEHVFVLGNSWEHLGGDVIVHIDGLSLDYEPLIFHQGSQNSIELPDIYSADVQNETLYIPTFEALWIYNFISDSLEIISSSEIGSGQRIFRLTSVINKNDLFCGGSKMDYFHFNGVKYSYDDHIPISLSHPTMKGGDRKDDVVVMVGYSGSYTQAIVARGYR